LGSFSALAGGESMTDGGLSTAGVGASLWTNLRVNTTIGMTRKSANNPSSLRGSLLAVRSTQGYCTLLISIKDNNYGKKKTFWGML